MSKLATKEDIDFSGKLKKLKTKQGHAQLVTA